VSIIIHRQTTSDAKRHGHTTIKFYGMIRNETDCPYGSKVKGNVLEGETDSEWMGKFNLTQLLGKASLGMGPAGPTLTKKDETRASAGFALGGRSGAEVLRRFGGDWDATISLDGTRCLASFNMMPNGTFVTRSYQRFSETGVQVGGVLRGRWNVYYSEDTQKERFWMHVKRLKSSGVNLGHDLLFLGDIDVVDTWKDIKQVLATQIDRHASLTNASASATDAQAAPEGSGAGQPPDVKEASGTAPPLPDHLALTPEDRGIFTRGKRRQYRLSGSIMIGWNAEPAFVGKYEMVQGSSMPDTGTLERDGPHGIAGLAPDTPPSE